jgi:hypothetical protein
VRERARRAPGAAWPRAGSGGTRLVALLAVSLRELERARMQGPQKLRLARILRPLPRLALDQSHAELRRKDDGPAA